MPQPWMRTWAEISLSSLDNNYKELRNLLAPGVKFLGVVKANAYGHGAVTVAQRLQALGADYLGVATLPEAIELRVKGGIKTPILIMGVTPNDHAEEVVEHHLTQCVVHPQQANILSQAASRRNTKVKVHIKVDTGMGRLGVLANNPVKAAGEIALLCAPPGLDVEGIFTHMANADNDEEGEEYTATQFQRFLAVIEQLEEAHRITFKIKHCAASGALLHYPHMHLDMVRPGLAIYGHYNDASWVDKTVSALKPLMTLKTRVLSVRTLPKGSTLSYGGTYTLPNESKIATLAIGYGDGLHRMLYNKITILIHGQRVPQLGVICMDLCVVNVTHVAEEVEAGDEAVIFGPELRLEEHAAIQGTVPGAVLCAVTQRVPRIYR
eukprot:Blabericola_migrator_1__5219@NODE_268_length_10573_cov_173_829050_g224_i0_p4_GENE_NODE_268_length_10573_cov_173_829050_g224_i0NODE_268_length_10573_cov_173_829050_g224_i0_p4_ORF_typecomplete_len380_score46_50Ala_racemase_N/PF01168_20/4_1e50Ala_racemase_C/PF00842_21/6_4e39_NODE_268_length_10573_cov_173_829050_g224_i018172956